MLGHSSLRKDHVISFFLQFLSLYLLCLSFYAFSISILFFTSFLHPVLEVQQGKTTFECQFEDSVSVTSWVKLLVKQQLIVNKCTKVRTRWPCRSLPSSFCMFPVFVEMISRGGSIVHVAPCSTLRERIWSTLRRPRALFQTLCVQGSSRDAQLDSGRGTREANFQARWCSAQLDTPLWVLHGDTQLHLAWKSN